MYTRPCPLLPQLNTRCVSFCIWGIQHNSTETLFSSFGARTWVIKGAQGQSNKSLKLGCQHSLIGVKCYEDSVDQTGKREGEDIVIIRRSVLNPQIHQHVLSTPRKILWSLWLLHVFLPAGGRPVNWLARGWDNLWIHCCLCSLSPTAAGCVVS